MTVGGASFVSWLSAITLSDYCVVAAVCVEGDTGKGVSKGLQVRGGGWGGSGQTSEVANKKKSAWILAQTGGKSPNLRVFHRKNTG